MVLVADAGLVQLTQSGLGETAAVATVDGQVGLGVQRGIGFARRAGEVLPGLVAAAEQGDEQDEVAHGQVRLSGQMLAVCHGPPLAAV
ncbi:hypothetical protein D3C80_1960280 [compost metagenome]